MRLLDALRVSYSVVVSLPAGPKEVSVRQSSGKYLKVDLGIPGMFYMDASQVIALSVDGMAQVRIDGYGTTQVLFKRGDEVVTPFMVQEYMDELERDSYASRTDSF